MPTPGREIIALGGELGVPASVRSREALLRSRRCPVFWRAMFTGPEIVGLLAEMGVTHVVSVPDSTIGQWDFDLRCSGHVHLVRVCREGEAWAVAGGLWLAGASPLVLIQCTGLFESGDALRNIIHDLGLPIFAMIGYRSYLDSSALPGDTCLRFTEPILDAWQIDWLFVDRAEKKHLVSEHFHRCRQARRAGVVLFAEGRA